MKRMTVSSETCTEVLAVLIMMAWADGRVEETERAGIRAAADVFNLTKELRSRLEDLLKKPLALEDLLLDGFSARDKSFAFVAAAWMSGVDATRNSEEISLLDKLAERLALPASEKSRLAQMAMDLEPLRRGRASWTSEIVALVKAIPQRLENDAEVEVSFD